MNDISYEVNLGPLDFLSLDNNSYGSSSTTDDTHLSIF